MSDKREYQVYIVVYTGDPIDFSMYRHTGLWFVPHGGGPQLYFNVQGSTAAYTFEAGRDVDPTKIENYARRVDVGRTSPALAADELAAQMRAVPVRNADPEFNCQGWVEDAVRRLCAAGFLTREEYDDGINGMVDVIAEARDEDIA